MENIRIYLHIDKRLPNMILDERNEEIYSEELHVERQNLVPFHFKNAESVAGKPFLMRKSFEINGTNCILIAKITYGVDDSGSVLNFNTHLEGQESLTRSLVLRTDSKIKDFSASLSGQPFTDTEKPNINIFDFEVQISVT